MSTSAKTAAAAAAATDTLSEDGLKYGFVGTLTKEQQECLRTAWDGLLAFFDNDQPRLEKLGLANELASIKLREETDESAASSNPSNSAAPTKGKSGTIKNKDKSKSTDIQVTRRELHQAFWEFVMLDHPDSILLRFLRARKWDVAKSLVKAIETLQWRIQEDVAGIIREGERKLNQRMLNMGQSYFHGEDKSRRPVCVINTRYHSKELQPFEDVKRFTIWTMETARLMLSSPEGRADILFDLADFTMANMDYNFVKFIVQCFQAYYPESLGVYMVASAPWIFSGIWRVVRPLLDPVVAKKFYLAKKLTDLQVHVDPSWLSVALDGKDTYEYYYPPLDVEADDARLNDVEGRKIRQAALTKLYERFTTETRDWIQKESATDSSSNAIRDATAAEIRTAYFQLDPYIRSRTLYHRLGVLTEDGVCDWSRLIRTKEQYEAAISAAAASSAANEPPTTSPSLASSNTEDASDSEVNDATSDPESADSVTEAVKSSDEPIDVKPFEANSVASVKE